MRSLLITVHPSLKVLVSCVLNISSSVTCAEQTFHTLPLVQTSCSADTTVNCVIDGDGDGDGGVCTKQAATALMILDCLGCSWI